jgi:hypothetical protein
MQPRAPGKILRIPRDDCLSLIALRFAQAHGVAKRHLLADNDETAASIEVSFSTKALFCG